MPDRLTASGTDIEVIATTAGTVLMSFSGSTGLGVTMHLSVRDARALSESLERVAVKATEFTASN